MSAIKKLYDKWPDLPHNWDDLPDGWFDLVDQLLIDLNKIPGWKNSCVTQIKSKFASLRFYCDTPDCKKRDLIEEMIAEAEKKSETMCEVCGKPGTVSGRGWWSCLCPEHTEEAHALGNKAPIVE